MSEFIVLKGSPRPGGNTHSLARIVTDELTAAGKSVEEYDLYRMDIRPCLACRSCQENLLEPACIQHDDMQKIFQAILSCRVVILATPVYSWYCTPPMKAALDRLVYAMNKFYGKSGKGPSLWAGKTLALLVTCGYPPEKGADLLERGIRRYCRHSGLHYFGMLAEHHEGYQTAFLTDEKRKHAVQFAERLLERRI